MLKNRHLESLCQVAKTGSFAKSADELGISLSTLSTQMKSLEAQLGVELFDRSLRPPALTPIGRRIAASAETVLAAEEKLLAAVSDRTKLSGIWRLGMVATASVRIMPGFLKSARQSAPEASFQVETALSEVLENRVLCGQLDAAIVSASDTPPKGLSYHIVREEPLIFAAPESETGKSIAQWLAEFPFLQFSPASGIGKQIEAYMYENFSPPAETIVLDSIEAIMECVNEGIGFTLLSEADARRYGRNNLCFSEPERSGPSRKLVLAYPERVREKEQIDALIDVFG